MKLLPAPKLKEYPIDFFAQEIFYRISKYNGNVGEYIQYKVSKNVKEKLQERVQERVNDKLKEKNKYEKSKEITNDNNENIKEEFLKRIKEILGESSIEVELD